MAPFGEPQRRVYRRYGRPVCPPSFPTEVDPPGADDWATKPMGSRCRTDRPGVDKMCQGTELLLTNVRGQAGVTRSPDRVELAVRRFEPKLE
jgi:hypothetical protein